MSKVPDVTDWSPSVSIDLFNFKPSIGLISRSSWAWSIVSLRFSLSTYPCSLIIFFSGYFTAKSKTVFLNNSFSFFFISWNIDIVNLELGFSLLNFWNSLTISNISFSFFSNSVSSGTNLFNIFDPISFFPSSIRFGSSLVSFSNIFLIILSKFNPSWKPIRPPSAASSVLGIIFAPSLGPGTCFPSSL